MKRSAFIAVITLVLVCSSAVVAALAYMQLSTIPSSYLPVPPNALNVQRGDVLYEYNIGAQGSGGVVNVQPGQQSAPTLQFDTTDSPQSVRTFYDNWLTANGWTPLSTGDPYVKMDRGPDLTHMSLEWEPGSILPRIVVPTRYYHVSVQFANRFSVGGKEYITMHIYLTAMSSVFP